jgi:polyphosphate kinase
MVRVAGLKRQQAAGLSSRSPDGLTPRDQLAAIADRVRPMVVEHASAATADVLPGLAAAGLSVIRWNDLAELRKEEVGEFFTEKIFPVVNPLAVDPGHPFP